MNKAFPDTLNPAKKDKKWLLQYAQAVISQQPLVPISRYAGRGQKMAEIRAYAMGKQSVVPYQRALKIDENNSESGWFTLDYTPLPIANKYRRTALGRLKDYDYNIDANVVDPISVDETDVFLKQVRNAVKIKEVAAKVAPDIAMDDSLNVSPGQPESTEEFDVWAKYSYKHRLAYESEIGISHVFRSNNLASIREKWRRDLFDFGIAVAKDYVEDGEVRIRWVDPRRWVVSFCPNGNFNEHVYAGEVMEVPIHRLREMAGDQFTEEEYRMIAEKGNAAAYKEAYNGRDRALRFYDMVTVEVLDMELITTDTVTYKTNINKRGNKVVVKAPAHEMNAPRRGSEYESKTRSRVYCVKYIIDTDYCFDAYEAPHQKRRTGSPYQVSTSYHAVAYDMEYMIPVGIMELMIPIIDNMQINWLKIQQCLVTAKPKGFAINMGSLENVPITNGKAQMSPEDLIRLYVLHGVVAFRQESIAGVPDQGMPITELVNGVDPSIVVYWNNIQSDIQLLRDVTGLNEMTDGSSINPKILTTPAEMANAATNNALSGIITSEEELLLSLAESIVMRLQSMVMAGDVYVYALGKDTNELLRLSKDMALRDFGIALEKKPTDGERKALIEEAKQLISGDLLDMADIFLIQESRNLKAVRAQLEFRMRKKREDKIKESMMLQQQNAQVQQQSMMTSEEQKRQTLQAEYMLKAELMKLEYSLKGQLAQEEFAHVEREGNASRAIQSAGILSNAQVAANASNAQPEMEDEDEQEDMMDQMPMTQ